MLHETPCCLTRNRMPKCVWDILFGSILLIYVKCIFGVKYVVFVDVLCIYNIDVMRMYNKVLMLSFETKRQKCKYNLIQKAQEKIS